MAWRVSRHSVKSCSMSAFDAVDGSSSGITMCQSVVWFDALRMTIVGTKQSFFDPVGDDRLPGHFGQWRTHSRTGVDNHTRFAFGGIRGDAGSCMASVSDARHSLN